MAKKVNSTRKNRSARHKAKLKQKHKKVRQRMSGQKARKKS